MIAQGIRLSLHIAPPPKPQGCVDEGEDKRSFLLVGKLNNPIRCLPSQHPRRRTHASGHMMVSTYMRRPFSIELTSLVDPRHSLYLSNQRPSTFCT
jgi:hypothetical protein